MIAPPASREDLEKLLTDDNLPPEFWGQVLYSALKMAAPSDPFAYGEYVFRMRAAAHHTEMIKFIIERLERRENAVVLEPRGHAKTTWANTILLSWLISKHPNLRVALISKTAKQANDMSRAIRFTLEANDYQQEIFGNLTGKHKWNDVEWIQADSALHGTKDVTMYSTGAGGALLSKRFDIIFLDDVLDENNSSTIEQREKLENWFWKTMKPTLVPGGSIIVVGTRWAEDDLYQRLIEQKHWPSLVRGAFLYDDDDVERERPRALWPEVWPLPMLNAEKNDMGSAMFACAYLNDISGLMAGNIFRGEWFQYFDPTMDFSKHHWRMGVDLASSTRERADYTARVITSEDHENNIYVHSVTTAKLESGHRAFIEDGYAAFPLISRIIVESNQFQSALVKELLSETRMPVIGRRADVDKVTRARAAAARYESKKVFHHPSLKGSDFEIQELSFPMGHDDMVDALGYAMEVGNRTFFFGSFGGKD